MTLFNNTALDNTALDDTALDDTAPDTEVSAEGEYDGPDRRDPTKPLARFDAEHSVLWLGDAPIPFRRGDQTNRELLRGLASCIREVRGLADDEPCHLRALELATFADLLDLDDRRLRREIRECLSLNKREAGDLVARLRRAAA